MIVYFKKLYIERSDWVIKKLKSSQSWIMYDEIFNNGIIRIKNNYIRILEVFPINFKFKSELEKISILESYKNFFKNLKLDIQICIYSQKENLEKYFNQIKTNNQKEKELKEEYEIYLTNLINENNIYYKRFFIVINVIDENYQDYFKELDNKSNLIINMISKVNDIRTIENKNDILDILNFLYKL